ncbi:hypothetical protein GCM10008107_21110 [Psychrosphaera saromensis]|uniref:SMODS and SLOG-associating 2TM effector domain-containing protein n=1 Tax=Psychrosphaera saromensis TaxID=716813 RepID=A0A2S7USS5_9GAMM|nr:hypothetical protein [Psychrosphaera saromensis]PQJ52798.1 hypothetical protein BTO11_03430 [Psychrosphaera saromensis]GHB71344.1 hypothetical protein GCM10008107_21110 [Psychrosphaera saromensis]GLQ13297.1 hypothetical protein GCM10007917_07520 [Psychrosphaera saromensis]
MSAIERYKVEKLNDQFTQTTRTVRRNLLIASSIAIALSVEGMKFKSFFGIDFTDQATAVLAIGAISLIAFYEFFSFLTYGVIDHRSWVLKANSIFYSHSDYNHIDIRKKLQSIDDQLGYIRGKMSSDDDSVVNAIKSQAGVIDRVVIDVESNITTFLKDLAKFRSQMNALNYMQLGRIYLLDWGVPLFMGFFSFYVNLESMKIFTRTVFGAAA